MGPRCEVTGNADRSGFESLAAHVVKRKVKLDSCLRQIWEDEAGVAHERAKRRPEGSDPNICTWRLPCPDHPEGRKPCVGSGCKNPAKFVVQYRGKCVDTKYACGRHLVMIIEVLTVGCSHYTPESAHPWLPEPPGILNVSLYDEPARREVTDETKDV